MRSCNLRYSLLGPNYNSFGFNKDPTIMKSCDGTDEASLLLSLATMRGCLAAAILSLNKMLQLMLKRDPLWELFPK